MVWFLATRSCRAPSPCGSDWWHLGCVFPPGQEQPHPQQCCVWWGWILSPLAQGRPCCALYLGVRQGWGAARAIPNIFHSPLWER